MKNRNICKFVTENTAEKINITQFIYESDTETMKMSNHMENNRMILIKSGKGVANIENKEYNFDAGNLIFVFNGEEMFVTADEKCEYMYIDFSGMRAELLFQRFQINEKNRVFAGFDGLIPLWHESLSRASNENLDLASESILLYTFSRMGGIFSKKDDVITKVLEITEERFTDSELSINAIAQELSYNVKYISHLFKKKMGVNYSEYLRNMRIKYAVSLLEYGIDSVKNVAFLSGFTDQLYFSAVFKKVVGVAPKEYKKTNTKEV